ncbi:molybdate ABC transporter substrate-binding protein [Actinomadura livida]|uniref:Molybdate ABC transporter substrate-binding protein n=1 Tax=Actinomadura livida TaxID=79909 RepID=A0A7W7MYS9_9ACTN|nr:MULTISPECIES: molybdate ABC transporter substrate-binding protein [Actinomadura]MBB4776226.1 molybdate transport system substrate-binding protein [Actinomadura catellatispora]GGU14599.1 molybdate-binding protein [Actinomadura livida]
MFKRALAVVSLLVVAVSGCGDVDDGGSPGARGGEGLTVFAAASLTEVFTGLGEEFEAAHPGVRVRFNFAGSSTLAQQIAQGAPVDVFAAASPATMATVTGAGDAAGRPRVFTRNRLVIAVPKDNPGAVESVGDLSKAGLKVILCAVQVPCGAAAEKALGAAGVKVEPVSREQDVKAVLTKVGIGEADAGLVYRTDAKAAGGRVKGIEFPESARALNDYWIVEVAEAPHSALAKEFIELVLGAQGRAALSRAGFEVP